MLDHRILLISLLAAFLAFQAVPPLFQGSTPPVNSSASRVVPIEIEPDAVIPEEG